MGKRLIVCILFLPAMMYSMFIWIPYIYLRSGSVPTKLPLDRLVEWAK